MHLAFGGGSNTQKKRKISSSSFIDSIYRLFFSVDSIHYFYYTRLRAPGKTAFDDAKNAARAVLIIKIERRRRRQKRRRRVLESVAVVVVVVTNTNPFFLRARSFLILFIGTLWKK